MKKHLFISSIAILCCLVASAQVDFGVKAGISANWIPKTFVGTAYSVVPQPAFYGGFSGSFEMADNMFIQGEVTYDGKGHSHYYIASDMTKHSYRAQLHYIQIPAYFGYNIEDAHTKVMIGPEFGALLAAKASDLVGSETVATLDIREYCAPLNLALAVQFNFMITDNIGFDLKFDFGLTRTFSKGYEYEGIEIIDKGHNTSVLLGLCYVFD